MRSLINHEGTGDPAAIARHLRVDELELRMSIDTESPRPTMDVLLAVIREYGVDPTWILTGEYDTGTHRRTLESDRAELIEVVKDVARRYETPLNIVAVPALWHDHEPPAAPPLPPEPTAPD